MRLTLWNCAAAIGLICGSAYGAEPDTRLPRQDLLQHENFGDNKDRDWYKANIPRFECPVPEIQTTYYYRWELLTKHLTYGSPNSGYSFTEFIDRPFWSGTYGAISCPAGHQLHEARWLRDPRYARDYARYWFRPVSPPRTPTRRHRRKVRVVFTHAGRTRSGVSELFVWNE